MDSIPDRVLRQPWHPSRRPNERLQRNVRRLCLTALGLAMLSLLAFLLVSPFWHPNTYWVTLSESQYSPTSGLALPHGQSTQRGRASWMLSPPQGRLELDEIPSNAELVSFLQDLQFNDFEPTDTLILYIRARGIVLRGEPMLMCRDFNIADQRQGTYSVYELFRRIASLRASNKLIVLEVEDSFYDARLGQTPGQFLSLVKKWVVESGREDLWVLSSHEDYQQPQNSPALKESLFRFWFERGIAGHADVDQSRSIDIGEVYEYVKTHVAAISSLRSNGVHVQRPELFWGGGDKTPRQLPQLVSTARFEPDRSANEFSNEVRRRQAIAPVRGEAAPTPQDEKPPVVTPYPAGDMPTTEVVNPSSEIAESALVPVNENGGLDGQISLSGREVGDQSNTGRSRDPISTEQRIAACWAIINQIDQSDYPQPMDVAPAVWQAIKNDLFWHEILDAQPLRDTDERQPKATLQSIHRGLILLLEGQSDSQSTDPKISLLSDVWRIGNRISRPAIAGIIEQHSGSLRQWVTENPLNGETDSVTWLAHRLADEKDIDEPLIRDLLSIHLFAEHLKDFPDTYHGSLRDRFLQAGRSRLFAERQLFDRTRTDWRQFVVDVLVDVRAQYESIHEDLRLLVQAKRTRHELIATLPAYLQLSLRFATDAKAVFFNPEELARLVDLLEDIDRYSLAQDMPRLGNVMRELAPFATRLSTDVDHMASVTLASVPPNLAALEFLARSPAVSYRQRTLIRNALEAADIEFWRLYDSSALVTKNEISDAPQRVRRAIEHLARIDLRLYRLRTLGLELHPNPEPTIGQSATDKWAFYESIASGYGSAVVAINRILAQRYSLQDTSRYRPALEQTENPDASPEPRDAGDDGKSPAESTTRLQADSQSSLQWCVRASGMLDHRDFVQFDVGAFLDYQSAARSYDQAKLQYDELWHSQLDANEIELDRIKRGLVVAINRLNVSKIGPPVVPDTFRRVAISGPQRISLEAKTESSFPLEFQVFDTTPQDVWIVLDYDASLLEVRASDDTPLLSRWPLLEQIKTLQANAELRSQWKGVLATASEQGDSNADQTLLDNLQKASVYPVNPAKVAIEPTMLLGTGATKSVILNVRRKANFGRETKLIAKIVAAGNYVRHETLITLPSPPTMRMISAEHPDLVTTLSNGLMLHPLPNRKTSFDLSIVNEHPIDKPVNITVFALKQATDLDLPIGMVSRQQADDIVARLSDSDVVAQRSQVTLSAKQSNPLGQLLAPAMNSTAQTDDTAVDTANAAGENVVAMPFGSEFGNVVMAQDPVTGESSFWQIFIAVQRPRRYVLPSISFDARTRRLNIEFTALLQSVVPPQGIPLNVQLRPTGADSPTKLTGLLSPPQYRTNLTSIVPTMSRWVDLQIDVDGYPRGFSYRISCDSSFTGYERQSDLFDLRLTLPEGLSHFAAPIDTLPIKMEVDAPVGSFPLHATGRDFIEIGLDIDRDREFRNERTILLSSDRSVRATAQLVGQRLVVDTKVDDFLLDLPTDRLANARANVLARLVSGTRQLWSNPIEVVLDSQGPTISRVELLPDRNVAVDGSIQVRATADDHGLSGVASVEFYVDTAFVGKFADESRTLPAVQDDLFRWTAEVSFKDIRPGTYDLLTRATDRVGNIGPVTATQVTVRDMATDPLGGLGNIVSGSVVYDNRPLVAAGVTLTPIAGRDSATGGPGTPAEKEPLEPLSASTNAKGQFIFQSVPPGAYSLRVAGVARNKTRISEQEISVEAKPGKPIRLELIAK